MRKCTENWIETYVEYSANLEASLKFHVWIGLSVIASVLQRKVYYPRGYFNIYPNLYVGIIGPTGDGKTTAANVGTEFLKQIPDVEFIEEKATSYYLYELFDQFTKTGHDCCCSIYAPEMKNFLADLNKTELVSMLTSFYTCPNAPMYRLKAQLVGGRKMQFKNVCVNLLACSTPEWLTTGTTTDDIYGGFTGRFVYVYEDSSDRSFPFPEDFMTARMPKLKQDLLDDLLHINTLKGPFIITDQAKAEYTVWYNDRKKECKDERLIGYYARKRDLVLKVSMLLAVAKDDDLIIDESVLHMAWKLLNQTEERMAEAFSGVMTDPALRYKDLVVSMLARAPSHTLTRDEILRKQWHKFDGVVLDRIVTNLIEAKMVKSYTKDIGGIRHIMYELLRFRTN
uniref:Putative primase n=1 Tax=viral metagenome TaxID=1070528 RepID=A0A6M3KJ98_9ZZZZ